MMTRNNLRQLIITGCMASLTVTGCAFEGVNSLRLPGVQGHGPGAQTYHAEIANVATLTSNSPVMIDDVVVGSVGPMKVRGGHADVEFSVNAGVVIPANAVASVGQTSLLGSMHLQLNPPLGDAPTGRLQPGATIALNRSSTYPSTERTLSALSLLVNGGGLGQLGDIIHNFNGAFTGHETDLRDMLSRLDDLVGTLDAQRDRIVESIRALNRLAETFAEQRDTITRALRDIPPALDVLIRERPRITTAMDKLRIFSDTTTTVVNSAKDDLVANLKNLQPALKVLADVGPELNLVLSAALVYPFTQNFIDRGVRGDYLNLFGVMDLTIPRLKRTMFLGTRFGQQNAALVPAPGDPVHFNYSYDPLTVGLAPPAANDGVPAAPPSAAPLVPVAPPTPAAAPAAGPPAAGGGQIFAGPYPVALVPAMPGVAPPPPVPGGGG